MGSTQPDRKLLGAWYTPAALIDTVIDGVLTDLPSGTGTVRVLDPACGDGRFLTTICARLTALGRTVEAIGCDISAAALSSIDDEHIVRVHADALDHDWGDQVFDIVVGNPPFLSQMATVTTRGGASQHGGGPYADAAAEFLALCVRLADPHRGCIGLVLPQSILAARDAGPVRAAVAEQADITWSWWQAKQKHFDAHVNVCALGFRRPATGATSAHTWTRVVTDRLGVPVVSPEMLSADGTVGDRALLNVNFRDEYYALVPAVSDDAQGPPLITSGLIDPGRCLWGIRPVRFAKRSFDHPRVDLSRLTGRFPAWAERKLVPKVLVANQTRVIEAVGDPAGAWLPGVPVTTVTPHDPHLVAEITAVLNSPVASAWVWQHGGGTGLSTTSVRMRPALLADIPWPRGSLAPAVERLAAGDLVGCGREIGRAYGLDDHTELLTWWAAQLPSI